MRARLDQAVGLLLALGSAAALIAHALWMKLPVVDDAAISIGYGLTLWSGHGFRLTENSQVVEGFSSPLWSIVTGLAGPLHVDPLVFAWWAGVIAGALSLLCFAAWGPAAEGRKFRIEDGLAGLAPLTVLSLCFWLSSGMETGLVSLMLSLCGLFALLEWRRGRGHVTGVMLGLLSITRPEGLLYGVLLGAWWLARRLPGPERYWRQTLGIIARTVLIGGGYLAFRWVYFASLFPNTYYAKQNWDFGASGYLSGFATEYQWLLVGAGLAALVGLTRASTRPRTVLALLFLGGTVLFVFKAMGDWMREWRFIVPAAPVLGVLFASALSATRDWWSAGKRVLGAITAALTLASFGTAAVTVKKELARLQPLKASPEFPASFVMQNAQAWKNTLDALGAKRPLVGLPDVGGASLVFRQGEVLDVAGLADYALARTTSYPAMEDYLFTEGAPSVIDAHGPSGHVGFPKLQPLYDGWSRGVTFFPRLTPDTDARCPGGKPAVLALTVEALEARVRELLTSEPLTALALWRCAFMYQDDTRLPPTSWRSETARLAEQLGDAARAATPEKALRYYSAATVIDGGSAHLRRKTETLRVALYPKPATP